ncbi:carbon-nitrogen hydrolase family protein [Actinomadura sp. K4S16]|uniref:carbon-nitrogen hydrolase family protein n=1 Tax=Actinomadura sp. K4S16 TaxID=1316147 RepID=UPI00190F6627|nr:carbon-nitrogen hydrolase family protein [Actinomadura sp. K4S16]
MNATGGKHSAGSLSVMVAQMKVSWVIEENLERISQIVARGRADDLILLPEGALSGYGTDLSPLQDHSRITDVELAARYVADLAQRQKVHLFCGSLAWDRGAWRNAVFYCGPDAQRWVYHKVNLAMNERDHLRPGNRLAPVSLSTQTGTVTVGVQICREIRFPEQWRHLVDAGADLLLFPTHAANPTEPAGVWRSHLISRAAENQRFVLACNAAEPLQHCPSMIINPRGEVLAETASADPELLRATIDLNQTSNWYLDQRQDLTST